MLISKRQDKKIIGIVVVFLLLFGLALFFILPKFKFSSLKVMPGEVYVNENFEIALDLENAGMISGRQTVEFFIEGELVGTDKVKVGAKETETARLSCSQDRPGIYRIEAGKERTFLKVFKEPSVKTQSAKNLTHYSAFLQGELIYPGMEDEVEVFFRYRESQENDWLETPRQTMKKRGSFSQTVKYLKAKTYYQFQAVVEWQGKESAAEIIAFTTSELAIAAFSSVIDNPQKYLPEDVGNYARVVKPASVYSSLAAVRNRRAFTSFRGIEWVNVHNSKLVADEKFYYVSWDWDVFGWISPQALTFPPLSKLRGVDLGKYQEENHLAMVYTDGLTVRSEPLVIPETVVDYLKKYDLVVVQEKKMVAGAVWYQIAPYQWVHSDYLRDLIPGTRPEDVAPEEKWIEVNLASQTIYAHRGDTPIYASLVSSGRPGFETVTKLFRPWSKLSRLPMSGRRFALRYELADVPWVIFFVRDYALHGAYWHDNFGTVQSAGCVNLSIFDSHWFFHWSEPELPPETREIRPPSTDPGTWVYVHSGEE